ncbi:DUF4214 domain-containing protein [Trichocoleus desertorum GB2-A4]|uniref:DUF4214 domain-containing protein n=2 Tax=Trichocoleusaceae TaxID=2303527 RepID=A0ABV0JFJ9_9CYAN
MSFNSRTISSGTSAFNTAKFIYLGSAPNDNEALIRQLYQDIHNREPDAEGLQYWVGQMASGITLSQVRTAFANSPEARNNINTAYRNILLRDAEPDGLQYHTNLLSSGATLRGLYEGISLSQEARSQFWVTQYFNNTDRTGSPVFAQSFGRTNTGFDRNWGTGSPSSWVDTDNFSARIFGQVSFGAGLQEIGVQADDGVRVRVGGQTVIDRLVDQPFVLNTGTFNAGNGGTFNVEIEYYERGGAAALNFSSIPLTPPDYSGNTLADARVINVATNTNTYQDWVGSLDTNDYYRFNLSSTSNFNLNLNGLSADADIHLLDANGNTLQGSANSATNDENIVRQLNAGTYYVQVFQFNGNTNYNLSLSATPVDLDGTVNTAQNIGALYGSRTFTDQVGTSDTNDYYRFDLSHISNLRLNLTGLSADADLEVLNNAGAVIGSSRSGGTTTEFINLNNLGSGTYYARVYRYSGETAYTLNLGGGIPDWYQTSIGTTNGGEQRHVTVERVNSPGFIENKPTWLVIHGWDGQANDFRELAGAIEEYDGHSGGGDYQVLTVDWDAARTGKAALNAAATWIDTVAEVAVNTIRSWGISASNINLVGHSLGAYVSYEISERLGGINNLVALNPATTTFGGYDHSQVSFSRYSNWSWAFWNNNATDSGNASLTADESFVLDLPFANANEGHGGAKILWTNMLKDKNGSVSQYFGLEDMKASAYKPWGNKSSGWEARIRAEDNRAGWGDPNWVATGWSEPGWINIG